MAQDHENRVQHICGLPDVVVLAGEHCGGIVSHTIAVQDCLSVWSQQPAELVDVTENSSRSTTCNKQNVFRYLVNEGSI